MTQKLLSALLISSSIFATSTTFAAKGPSSEIPDKREFPLSTTANPCDDFHKYVCENVEASFKLRPDRSSHTFAFADSRERILNIKKKFMSELPTRQGLDERGAQLRDFYMACMDKKDRAVAEKSEVKKLQKDLNSIESAEDLITYANNQTPRGMMSPFVMMGGNNNLDNPKKVDIFLGSRLMNLPDHKYYEQADLMADYKKLLVSFFKNIDPKIKAADAEKRAQGLIDMEKEYIKTYPVASVRRERWSERHISTQEEILKKYPNLKLDMLMKKAPKDAVVSTPIPESFVFLNDEITKRPLQTWKDVILVRNLSDIMDDAYPKFFQQNFDFEKKYFGGPETRPDRQERCTDLTEDHFPKEVDSILIDQVFPNFDEKKVQAVAEDIRASIIKGLENNKWLTSDGRKGAIAKIKTARLQLVKPHTDKEWDFMPIRKYTKTDAIVNMKLFREAAFAKTVKELGEPANLDAWGMGPLTVNAYYSQAENKFVLPMGILQYPFYDKDGSVIENLGAVGAVTGHELGHSIDDNGAKYDNEGRLKQWMAEKDIDNFNSRQARLVKQFNEAGHDGKLTLGENTADLVGVTFAYNAAFPGGKGSVEDKKKFFVAYGRVWCTVIRPDYDKLMRKVDPHSAGWARINEQVKQQPAFAETFQCKAGDKMTLPDSERVQIW